MSLRWRPRNWSLLRSAGVMAALLSPSTASSAERVADTVYLHGVVITVDDNMPAAQAVAVKDGRRLTPMEALKALTIWPAWQHVDEDLKGSITPGKYADFVILGANPLTVDPMSIKDVPVLMTIKEGKLIFELGVTSVAKTPLADTWMEPG